MKIMHCAYNNDNDNTPWITAPMTIPGHEILPRQLSPNYSPWATSPRKIAPHEIPSEFLTPGQLP